MQEYKYDAIYEPMEGFNNNPFEILHDWINCEILDCQSIMNTLASKNEFISQKIKVERELKMKQATLTKISTGKVTLKMLLTKNKEQKAKELADEVQRLQESLDKINFILHVLVARVHEHELPRFKARKGENYIQSVQQYAKTMQEECETRIKVCATVANGKVFNNS